MANLYKDFLALKDVAFKMAIAFALIFAYRAFFNYFDSTDAAIPVSVQMPVESVKNRVLVWAPENCTAEEGKRTKTLLSRLKEQGIPYKRTSLISFPGNSGDPNDIEEERQSDLLLRDGELPIVFYKGKGMANPGVEQVEALYKGKSI